MILWHGLTVWISLSLSISVHVSLCVQKQEVRSCAALFRGALRQAWQWRWGAGWLGKPAGSPPTAAWTATAPRESKETSHVLLGALCGDSMRFFWFHIFLFFQHSCTSISVVTTVFLCFSLIFPGVRLSSDAQFSDFLDGLGPAQLVGRQTLATPPMGQNSPFNYHSALTLWWDICVPLTTSNLSTWCLLFRWHPDRNGGEERSPGGGGHQSPWPCGKTRFQGTAR